MAFIYSRADHLAQQGGGFEPQRNHNWAVQFNLGNGNDDIIKLSLVAGFLPISMNENVTISYGNEEVYVAGKVSSEVGSMTCRDWVDQPTASILFNWRRTVYNPYTGAINLARNYKHDASIILSSPNVDDTAPSTTFDGRDRFPTPVPENQVYTRVWKLQGCWPIRVVHAPQGLDMTNSGMVMVSVDVRFDKAIPVFAIGDNAGEQLNTNVGDLTFTGTSSIIQ